jgi:hypothetical protein
LFENFLLLISYKNDQYKLIPNGKFSKLALNTKIMNYTELNNIFNYCSLIFENNYEENLSLNNINFKNLINIEEKLDNNKVNCISCNFCSGWFF